MVGIKTSALVAVALACTAVACSAEQSEPSEKVGSVTQKMCFSCDPTGGTSSSSSSTGGLDSPPPQNGPTIPCDPTQPYYSDGTGTMTGCTVKNGCPSGACGGGFGYTATYCPSYAPYLYCSAFGGCYCSSY